MRRCVIWKPWSRPWKRLRSLLAKQLKRKQPTARK
jgi:hypothetical protein